jgi:hypothetical protein
MQSGVVMEKSWNRRRWEKKGEVRDYLCFST